MNIRYVIQSSSFERVHGSQWVLSATTRQRKYGYSPVADEGQDRSLIDLRACPKGAELIVTYRLRKATLLQICELTGIGDCGHMTTYALAEAIFSARDKLFLLFGSRDYAHIDVIRTYLDVNGEQFICLRRPDYIVNVSEEMTLPEPWAESLMSPTMRIVSQLNNCAQNNGGALNALRRLKKAGRGFSSRDVFIAIGADALYDVLKNHECFDSAFSQSQMSV